MAPKRKSEAAPADDNEKKAKTAEAGTTDGGKAEAVLPSLADSQSYCKEVGINMQGGGSAAVFQWLCCSIIFGNRISEKTTIRAAKGLIKSGLTDPRSVKESGHWDKVEALNSQGNVQRGPSMADRLESTAALILEKYDGDIENLRKAADKDPEEIKKLVKECKGIGETGVNIFCREAQLAWPELFPFADERSLTSAASRGFPSGSPEELAKFCNNDRETFVTLLASMTKDELRFGNKPGSATGNDAGSNEAGSKEGKENAVAKPTEVENGGQSTEKAAAEESKVKADK